MNFNFAVVNSVLENLKASMMPVRGGHFIMGDQHGLYKPLLGKKIGYTNISLEDFHICSHPVTNAEWEAVMGGVVSGNPNIPRTGISWHEALDFIVHLNKISGWDFRLPTEAEWEYAARGGEFSHDDVFSGGNILDIVGWYRKNSGGELKEVCRLQSNQLGLFDMSGNVREWCSDIYDSSYPKGERLGLFSSERKPIYNPRGALAGKKRVVRGGSYLSDEQSCWVFFRDKMTSTDSARDCGFRLAY